MGKYEQIVESFYRFYFIVLCEGFVLILMCYCVVCPFVEIFLIVFVHSIRYFWKASLNLLRVTHLRYLGSP